jgi:hypothetical protein
MPRMFANSICDSGASALAMDPIVIQLAWLNPIYFKRRSMAAFQARDVLCSAPEKRSSKVVKTEAL